MADGLPLFLTLYSTLLRPFDSWVVLPTRTRKYMYQWTIGMWMEQEWNGTNACVLEWLILLCDWCFMLVEIGWMAVQTSTVFLTATVFQSICWFWRWSESISGTGSIDRRSWNLPCRAAITEHAQSRRAAASQCPSKFRRWWCKSIDSSWCANELVLVVDTFVTGYCLTQNHLWCSIGVYIDYTTLRSQSSIYWCLPLPTNIFVMHTETLAQGCMTFILDAAQKNDFSWFIPLLCKLIAWKLAKSPSFKHRLNAVASTKYW